MQSVAGPNGTRARDTVLATEAARGKLTIFLGYAAGVGKTYAMLDAALQQRAAGTDTVGGYVETHGEAAAEALLQGIEVVPPRQIEQSGRVWTEVDVDAILARRPQLVLIDDLAHTNAPTSRHLKRYQDVQELRAAGIDVYTALDVQHLESLKDVVAQITGITIHETVPDGVLDEADEIKLVDLPTAELLQRAREGKVHALGLSPRTFQQLFRPGNLAALRQLTLRRVAERVDMQMRAYMQRRDIPGPWPAGERLLVCIGPGPLGERLVRSGRRLAAALDAEWFALYVEAPGHTHQSEAARDRLSSTLRLAEELGAKAETLPGDDVAATIRQYALSHNITKIIIGKQPGKRWSDLLGQSTVDQVIRVSGDVDVYVVNGNEERARPFSLPVNLRGWRAQPYVYSVLLVLLVTAFGELIRPLVLPSNVVMVYLLAVVIAAIRWGHGPSILGAVLSALAFDFFFIPPHLTFAIADTQYLLTFVAFIAVGLVISTLAARVREQAEAAEHREAYTASLYALSRDLAGARNMDDILDAIITHVAQTFTREAAVLLPEGESLVARAHSPGFVLDDAEQSAADWAFRHGEPAGRGTDTLPSAGARYLPLVTARRVAGVLGVRPANPAMQLTPEQRRLLEAFASQAAVAIERVLLAEEARRAHLLQATEKLQSALLNSISHDLRTPLASITGALSSLLDEEVDLDETTRRSLAETAREEAERLNRLVGNLLDMTRLESGALRVAQEACDVQDLVGAALAQLANRLAGRPLIVDVPADLPLVQVDFALMTQALANLIDNALKYSAANAPVEFHACAADGRLEIHVADRGIGIPTEDLERVFDKFYRVQRANQAGGTGLGLAIARGIVEAHGGHICAENRSGGGTLIRLTLPLIRSQPDAEMAA